MYIIINIYCTRNFFRISHNIIEFRLKINTISWCEMVQQIIKTNKCIYYIINVSNIFNKYNIVSEDTTFFTYLGRTNLENLLYMNYTHSMRFKMIKIRTLAVNSRLTGKKRLLHQWITILKKNKHYYRNMHFTISINLMITFYLFPCMKIIRKLE